MATGPSSPGTYDAVEADLSCATGTVRAGRLRDRHPADALRRQGRSCWSIAASWPARAPSSLRCRFPPYRPARCTVTGRLQRSERGGHTNGGTPADGTARLINGPDFAKALDLNLYDGYIDRGPAGTGATTRRSARSPGPEIDEGPHFFYACSGSSSRCWRSADWSASRRRYAANDQRADRRSGRIAGTGSRASEARTGAADRGLRADRRPADRRAGRPATGSIDWLCFPRFDSEACLRRAARRRRRTATGGSPPATATRCTQPALPRRHAGAGDRVVDRDGTSGSSTSCPSADDAPDVVRIVEGVAGRVTMRSELRLRFDYGRRGAVGAEPRRAARRRRRPGRGVVAGRDVAPVRARLRDVRRLPGRGRGSACRSCSPGTRRTSTGPEPVDAVRGARADRDVLAEWVAGCTYDADEFGDAEVTRSLLTLKALTYAPDRRHRRGADDLAARGARRVAQLGLPVLLAARRDVHPAGAASGRLHARRPSAWREWLLRAVAGSPGRPADHVRRRPASGGCRSSSWPGCPGYEGVGAGAGRQRGRRPAAARRLRRGDGRAVHWPAIRGPGPRATTPGRMQRGLMRLLEPAGSEPDEGIWEVRGGRQHFIHSKVMAWVALDRAVRAVERFGLDGPVDAWRALRDEIHRDVCDEGLRPRPEHLHPVLRSQGAGRRRCC